MHGHVISRSARGFRGQGRVFAKHGGRGDRGAAMIVALLLVVMVVLIGVTAVSETLDSDYQAAVTLKAVQVVAAGRAGVDAEVANLEEEASAGQSLTCSAGGQVNGVGSGAANAASAEGYTMMYYAEDTTSASNAMNDLGSPTTRSSCPATIAEPAAKTWYLAVEAIGSTPSHAYNSAKPSTAVLQLTKVASSSFNDAAFTGEDFTPSGNFNMYLGTAPAMTYTAGPLTCQNTANYLAGDVWVESDSSSPGTSGSCVIDGNLYVNGSLSLSASTTVEGTIFATGNVTLVSGSFAIGGIVADGSVTINGSATTTIAPYNGTLGDGDVLAQGNIELLGDNNGSSVANYAYSAGGTVTNDGTPVGGASGAHQWPAGCTLPVGSAESCVAGGFGPALESPLPSQSFPSLTYSGSPFSGPTWTYYNDSSDNCNSNPAGAGLASPAVYNEIAEATTPTVISTPCAVAFGNITGSSSQTIQTDVAIFASGGFWFDYDQPVLSGAGACSSSTPCEAFFVVPCDGTCASGPLPANGSGSSCPGKKSNFSLATLEGADKGDIWMQAGVDGSTVHSFFYTPDNFCAEGSPGTSDDPNDGQMYIGGNAILNSQLFLTADTSLFSKLPGASTTWSTSVVAVQ